MSTPGAASALSTAIIHLNAAKYYALASFVMLVYDIMLTLPREVNKIWRKTRFSGLTVIWVCNRWVFLLMVIPTIASMHDPAFTRKVCDNYFRYPGYVQAFQRTVIGSFFILRTYCLYNRSLKVAALIAVFLAAEIFVKLYTTIKWGQAVQPPPGIIACVLSVSPANSGKFIIYFLMELITDALVLVLTVIRSAQTYFSRGNGFRRRSGVSVGGDLLRLIFRDGVIYFTIMCCANLITVLMYLIASEDLKAANADFAVMMNSLLVARLILNLKSARDMPPISHQYRPSVSYSSGHTAVAYSEPASTYLSSTPGYWETVIIGDIGNGLESDIVKDNLSVSTTSTLYLPPDTIALEVTTPKSITDNVPTLNKV